MCCAGESRAAFEEEEEDLDGKQRLVLSVEKEEEVTAGCYENVLHYNLILKGRFH